MEIGSDIQLRGPVWEQALQKLDPIFVTLRPKYDAFLLAAAIGITYDKQEDSDTNEDAFVANVDRKVLMKNSTILDIMYQTAIISTAQIEATEDERLEMAFGDTYPDAKKINFLTRYANYGVHQLLECCSDDPLETMENLKNLLATTVEGNNFDVDGLSDDVLEDLDIF